MVQIHPPPLSFAVEPYKYNVGDNVVIEPKGCPIAVTVIARSKECGKNRYQLDWTPHFPKCLNIVWIPEASIKGYA